MKFLLWPLESIRSDQSLLILRPHELFRTRLDASCDRWKDRYLLLTLSMGLSTPTINQPSVWEQRLQFKRVSYVTDKFNPQQTKNYWNEWAHSIPEKSVWKEFWKSCLLKDLKSLSFNLFLILIASVDTKMLALIFF